MNWNTIIGGVATATFGAIASAAPAPHHGELEEVVVTATPMAEDRLSTTQPTSVLAGDALVLSLAPTIGETVGRQPGVQSTFFGPAASRPVIRGLGGDRVQVLTDGLATLDASGLSEDHAVAIDPALSDQIEVVRGPAALLYGSGASGGVVNVVTNRLHDQVPAGLQGMVEVRGDSALEERAIAGRIDAGLGPLALHVDAVRRETDDFEIPGFAQSHARREQLLEAGEAPGDVAGKVPNSWSDTLAGGAGVTWVGDAALAGLAYSRHDTEYGIPTEDGLFIDLEQDRIDLATRLDLDAAGGLTLKLRAAVSDYQHAEIEAGGEIGTLYRVDGSELRAAVDHSLPGGFTGTGGLQWQEIELAASGEEAFVPGSTTRTWGVFMFEERDFQAASLELGLRLDNQQIHGPGLDGYDSMGINASLGGLWQLGDRLALVGQLVRSERHPSATELYADGPHAATQQFEIGDPDFRTERGLTADVGLRRTGDAITAEIRAFASRYDRYIYLAPTGTEVDGLPAFQFLQRDARFHGFEAEIGLPLGTDTGFALTLSGDYVRGRLNDGGDLPRMPPLRLGASLSYAGGPLAASLTLRHHLEQDRVAALELPTDAYTLLDADLAWTPGWGARGTLLFLRASNLLDEDARMHSSPLKDELPLPGRSIAAGLRFVFGD